MVKTEVRHSAWVIFLFLFFLSTPVHAAEPKVAEPKVVEVLKNIYTMIHGAGIDSNSTFIITSEGVIVIDTRTTPAEGDKVMQEIRKHTDLPIKYTINTHFHGDHTFGNQVFRESDAIIAHKNVRKSLDGESGQKHLDFFKTFEIPGMEEVTITLPNIVYENSMELYVGEYHLELLHLGRGHTDGDTAIYMPELRTIITGDLVFYKKIPFMGHGYIDDWIKSLFILENLDAELVVPGHGKPGGKPLIILMKHYLMQLRTHVQEQIKRGKTLKETQDAVRPILQKKYHDWQKLDWIDGNIERAYLEYGPK